MKLKSAAAMVIAGFAAISAMAGGSSSAPAIAVPPDGAKLSYAVGTRMGLQILGAGTNVDATVAIQAIQDVLTGKPTMIQEAEIAPVLNRPRAGGMDADTRAKFSYAGGMRIALLFKHSRLEVDSKIIGQAIQDELEQKSKMPESEVVQLFKQAAAYEETHKSSENKAAADAFLAQNAKAPGVNVLPDGLQYQIIDPGTGPLATTNDLIFVKFRGTFINGAEFEHHNHFLTRIYGGIQGWKDVLPRMKIGSKWRIFAPPALAYGSDGYPSRGVGPDMAVIYDLELISIAPPGGNYQVSSGMGKGADVDASSPVTDPVQ